MVTIVSFLYFGGVFESFWGPATLTIVKSNMAVLLFFTETTMDNTMD